AKSLFDVWGEKHYRAQPEPKEPLMMFEPDKQKSGIPGLVSEWNQTGDYPEFIVVEPKKNE
ncbi:MAG: hypothetical protein HY350_05420, partial [Candidatus Omnitrophica bacterium]|nr:hypothetical protein [Candidatus Omnitrophota bacterium]